MKKILTLLFTLCVGAALGLPVVAAASTPLSTATSNFAGKKKKKNHTTKRSKKSKKSKKSTM